jgi:hypothetical protein
MRKGPAAACGPLRHGHGLGERDYEQPVVLPH